MSDPSPQELRASERRLQYVVITPVRNEANYVGRTIESMAMQTALPSRWVIVDDGSTDGTATLLSAAATRLPWLTIIQRPDRGFRQSGAGVIEAFNDGYSVIADAPWDFIVKLDGDLAFEPDYFEQCLRRFADDPQLGIAGGTIYVRENGEWKVDCPGDPPFHVRGATKIYRWACWQDIQPLVCAPGWDTVDEVLANMKGWRTRTFPDARLIQHRATGAMNGKWSEWFKNGRANYVTGYHPVFMLGKCVKHLWANPSLVAAAGLWAGYCSGYFSRERRVADVSAVRYLRRQQIRWMTLRSSIYRQDRHTLPSPVYGQ